MYSQKNIQTKCTTRSLSNTHGYEWTLRSVNESLARLLTIDFNSCLNNYLDYDVESDSEEYVLFSSFPSSQLVWSYIYLIASYYSSRAPSLPVSHSLKCKPVWDRNKNNIIIIDWHRYTMFNVPRGRIAHSSRTPTTINLSSWGHVSSGGRIGSTLTGRIHIAAILPLLGRAMFGPSQLSTYTRVSLRSSNTYVHLRKSWGGLCRI